MKTLILVESPTKARTIARYARGLFGASPVLVRSTSGHLRDLPAGALGVDVANGFTPQYEVRNRSVSALRPLVRQAERIVLATDPDREGEAIAWHITKVFESELRGKEILRAAFHEITPGAIQRGLSHPRPLDLHLVQAAVARRVTDRLIGYHISPRMWAALSGEDHGVGRVQAATLQMLHSRSKQWEVYVEL
jgi:DNA topoisomerase-1